MEIFPVILAGGSGTRLWPLSRKSYPKQFANLVGVGTLFQQSALRMSGADFEAPIVVTNSDFRFIVTEQLQEVGVDPGAIIIEPTGKNSGPAVLAAALAADQQSEGARILVAPSDHLISDGNAFLRAVVAANNEASHGRLVTFGVQPTRPETGYGYLELSHGLSGAAAPIPLKRFVEKPNEKAAAEMLASGKFLWNAGVFLFTAKDIIAAFEQHAPEMSRGVRSSFDLAKSDLGFLRLDPDAWEKVPEDSIDYAVMEKAKNLSVVPLESEWTDLGGWDAVWREGPKDSNNVQAAGNVSVIDCHSSILRSESDGLELVGIGLENIVAVAMNDAVLIADMNRTQDVKLAVTELKKKNSEQATTFPKDHRPWGWFESLVIGKRFQVKRIHVHPGAALSLQSHFHRSEHWIVVEGTAKVTVDDVTKTISENESVYIPLGAVHRMENPGKVPMVLVEVQTGTYLGEDDIVRYDDVYSRGQGAKG